MANIVEKTYTFQTSNISNYWTVNGLWFRQAGFITGPLLLYGNNTGTATMNDTGKSILYPKNGISPFKMDYSFRLHNATGADMNFYFSIDNTEIVNLALANGANSTFEETDLITEALINSTNLSELVIKFEAKQNGLFRGAALYDNSYITFYYQQWDLIAQRIGDGDSLLFSPGRLYEGESATFSALVNQNSTWHGWYSDVTHTQLLSTDLNYTVTASQDLTIYGYSTKNNGLYNDLYYCSEIKNCEENKNNSYDLVYKYYIKTFNGWELQTSSTNFNKDQNYILEKRQPIYRILSNLSNTTTHRVSTVRNYLIYYDFINQEEYYIQSITLNVSSPLTDIIIPKNKGFWCQAKSNISITINYFDSVNFNIITKTLTYRQEVGAQSCQIQIKDENDNINKANFTAQLGYTVPNNITGLKEIYNGTPTGRILQSGQTYYDVCDKSTLYYEYVNNNE